ncbi:MAG: hypothetical protein CTY19_06380 [Methylomonas sp.]|nr:MAG: hypothetical protein CTY19_06380 [Methylomonas sp.]
MHANFWVREYLPDCPEGSGLRFEAGSPWRTPLAEQPILRIWLKIISRNSGHVVPAYPQGHKGIAGTQKPRMAKVFLIPVNWIPAIPAGMTA